MSKRARNRTTIPKTNNWKDKIENHIVWWTLAVAIMSGSVVGGTVLFISSKQIDLIQEGHNVALNSQEMKLTSIDRRIGEKGFLDIRSCIIPRSDGVKVPVGAMFYQDDDFYASPGNSLWVHSKITELELMHTLYEAFELPPNFEKNASTAPVHIWQPKDARYITISGDHRILLPHITLQKYPITKLIDSVEIPPPTKQVIEHPTHKIEVELLTDEAEYLKRAENFFRGDASGLYLQLQIEGVFSMMKKSPNVRCELVNVQKVGNVLYGQFLITLKDAVVGKETYPLYYLRREFFIVSTPTDIFLIATYVPSSDSSTRGSYFKYVSEWFAQLAIPVG